MNITELKKQVETKKTRGAWAAGVKAYALDIIDGIIDNYDPQATYNTDNINELYNMALNGAANWNQYSWGGSSLIYDQDIARRLCNPTELKKTQGGTKKPNNKEEWLDTQARALYQAWYMIVNIINN